MDPVVLATITSGVTLLASEAAKGIGGSVGKDVWDQIKTLLGWTSDPDAADLAPELARKMTDDEALAEKILALLNQEKMRGNPASAMVGHIVGKNVMVANTVKGTINLS